MAKLGYTVAQLNEAIKKVFTSYADVSKVDATSADVSEGKKFVASDKTLRTGTAKLVGGIEQGEKFATKNDILQGKVAYTNEGKVVGEIVSIIPEGKTYMLRRTGLVNDDTYGMTLRFGIPETGFYKVKSGDSGVELYANYNDVATALGITSNMILSGYSILGVNGTATPSVSNKLPAPVLQLSPYGTDCVFTFENNPNADYYIFYSNGTLIPAGYWRPALAGGVYTITIPASYFKDGSYAITGKAVAPSGSPYQDSDVSNPIIYNKGVTASGFPIEVSTASEMDEALSGATMADVGKMYKYTGATTAQYKQNELYVITDETNGE